jgi:hypothetical protein
MGRHHHLLPMSKETEDVKGLIQSHTGRISDRKLKPGSHCSQNCAVPCVIILIEEKGKLKQRGLARQPRPPPPGPGKGHKVLGMGQVVFLVFSPPWASVSLSEVWGKGPFLLLVGGAVAWAELSPPGCFVLAAQCAFACHSEGFVCGAARLRLRPRYLRGEAAAGAGGASLGRRRLRHVLDTGLSGLEPPHKSLGRRRNKGLFHAATEKPQISRLGLRRREDPAARPGLPLPWACSAHSPVGGLHLTSKLSMSPSLSLSCSDLLTGSPGHVRLLDPVPC